MVTVNLEQLKVVPEEYIVYCASYFVEENNYKKLLRKGHKIRLAGLNPIYLCDLNFKTIMVTSEENLNREYH